MTLYVSWAQGFFEVRTDEVRFYVRNYTKKKRSYIL